MRGADFIKYLHELFVYNPETGEFFWRERPASHFINSGYAKAWNAKLAGKMAG
jgi:hypothetical protein